MGVLDSMVCHFDRDRTHSPSLRFRPQILPMLSAGHEHASAISLGTLKQGREWYQQERLIVSVITVSALISEINHGHITKYNKVAPPTRTYSRALMGVGG